MLSPDMPRIIEHIHATPHRLVFEFAGAGSLALWWLHSVAGSSRTLLEATDRYAAAALADLLGFRPTGFVSAETARAMAQRAYERALHLAEGQTPVLGVACTATIATDRAKRGDHGAVVAVRSAPGTALYALTLTKGLRDRAAEERLVSQLVIRAIVGACELELPTPLELAAGEEVRAVWTEC